MLEIAILADLHLTRFPRTAQYKALAYARERILRKKPDVLVCLGDMTAVGDAEAAAAFREAFRDLPLKRLFLPGNADLRRGEDNPAVALLSEGKLIEEDGFRLLGLDTSEKTLSREDRELLARADGRTLVFMHHPPEEVAGWDRRAESCMAVIYGHRHFFLREGNRISVNALDPDKAMGGPPEITWIALDGKDVKVTRETLPGYGPEGIEDKAGISCFSTEAVLWAAENRVPSIELRPGSVSWERPALPEAVARWRERGGKYLSLHMPDYGAGCDEAALDEAIAFAGMIGVDGATFHVPKLSVGEMKTEWNAISAWLAGKIGRLPPETTVGIENLHMTPAERPDDARRFGYTPEECVAYADGMARRCGERRVGILLDVGHARYNGIYAEEYPVGVWYALCGERIVAYHLHQVAYKDGELFNHNPIESVYGPLISYCGFSWCWNDGILPKRPAFAEIRGEYAGSYRNLSGRKSE